MKRPGVSERSELTPCKIYTIIVWCDGGRGDSGEQNIYKWPYTPIKVMLCTCVCVMHEGVYMHMYACAYTCASTECRWLAIFPRLASQQQSPVSDQRTWDEYHAFLYYSPRFLCHKFQPLNPSQATFVSPGACSLPVHLKGKNITMHYKSSHKNIN